jgi:hypothetical protein
MHCLSIIPWQALALIYVKCTPSSLIKADRFIKKSQGFINRLQLRQISIQFQKIGIIVYNQSGIMCN